MKKIFFSLVVTALFSASATANTTSTVKGELQTKINVTNDNGDEDQYQENWKFFGTEIKTLGPCDELGLQPVQEVLYIFGIPVSTSTPTLQNCKPSGPIKEKIEDIN